MAKFNTLAVSDEIYNLDSIERTLKQVNDTRIIKSNNPDLALDIIRSQSIQIIISDQKIGKVSGIELLQKVYQSSPDTIRIILTSYTDVQEILDTINIGHVYGYLIKPWSPKELQTIIQRAQDYFNLQASNRLLSIELQEKNELLKKKNADLERFNELKNQFMVVSSHELRTPATIISGALELLWQEKSSFNPGQQRLVENALKGSYRLNEIISTFFETLKWNADKNVLDTASIEIGTLLRMVLNRFTPFLEKRNLTIEEKLEDNLFVLGDQKKLYLVFENLLSNAIKYTPDGGAIKIEASLENLNVVIRFRDTGIGIPKDELSNIFDTFYQLGEIKYHHSSRHEFMGGGTGLGLSLCKSIITAHQGKIFAESDGKDKGSCFHVFLPLYH